MDNVLLSNNIKYSAESLMIFAEEAQGDTNKSTLVKHFYERMGYLINDYAYETMLGNGNGHFYVCDEEKAVRMFVSLMLPAMTSPGKSLTAIRTYGMQLFDEFHEPIGECITKDVLIDILSYLDDSVDFFKKVFPEHKVAFFILPYSHNIYNSYLHTANIGNRRRLVDNYYLFSRSLASPTDTNPIQVLFRELGLAVNAHLSGNPEIPYARLIEMLGMNRFVNIHSLDTEEKLDICADVIMRGLMYNTPFDKYEPPSGFGSDDKSLFKLIVDRLLSYL